MQGVKWTEPKSNCVPGLTKEVSFFQLLGHRCLQQFGSISHRFFNGIEEESKAKPFCLGGSLIK